MSAETVARNIDKVNNEIATVCAKSGRAVASVSLIAVSKRIPQNLVMEAYYHGHKYFGENRVQDALARLESITEPDIQWHFIGNIQKNKVRKVVGRFNLLHAVDSIKLAERISTVATEMNLVQPVLLEVNASEEEQKHGISPDEVVEAVKLCSSLPGIELQGFMTMAKFGATEEELRTTFAKLRRIRDESEKTINHDLPHLSMGMSGDYPIAIEEGATLIRVGTSIFGKREK
ncbi:MAG: YggS family pyridoxal phosphate-dependent enzyme [bacterium]|nr:YggS family pyridoxal phosphate-dependent enzyme [bacterium]